VAPAFRPVCILSLTLVQFACASVPAPKTSGQAPKIAVLTPRDAVPIHSLDALSSDPRADSESARAEALSALAVDLRAALARHGMEVAGASEPSALLQLDTEIIAYGDIRRSWLWMLGAQALLAGIGHGVVVSEATHNSKLAWEAGSAEFLVETTTWVGGAWVGGRYIDPVLVRVRLYDPARGTTIHRWTREGLRPWREWLHYKGGPPRDQRLRSVADTLFDHLAPKVKRAAERYASQHPAPALTSP
jgi:hypothetical protein